MDRQLIKTLIDKINNRFKDEWDSIKPEIEKYTQQGLPATTSFCEGRLAQSEIDYNYIYDLLKEAYYVCMAEENASLKQQLAGITNATNNHSTAT